MSRCGFVLFCGLNDNWTLFFTVFTWYFLCKTFCLHSNIVLCPAYLQNNDLCMYSSLLVYNCHWNDGSSSNAVHGRIVGRMTTM